jgi:hypothetical protein
MLEFTAAPILESALCSKFLSEETRDAILPSEWVRVMGRCSTDFPDVYVCEAHGGAIPEELAELISAINRSDQSVILIWTEDWPFPSPEHPRLLIFDVFHLDGRCCGYTWQAKTYGPSLIPDWKPFGERKILASFAGSRKTHGCREILFDNALSGDGIVVRDIDWWNRSLGHEVRRRLQSEYATVLSDSKFAFCPRGNGPSSKRRWEAAYSGAIPILIDDFTTPWGVSMPLLNFVTDPQLSASANVENLMAVLQSGVSNGQQLQDDLKACLLDRFDAPIVSPHHTGVKHIVEVANRAWIPGYGFIYQ